MLDDPGNLAEFALSAALPVSPPDGPVDFRWRYRQQHFETLLSVLDNCYPVTKSLLGEDVFSAIAYQFALKSPPDSPLLLDYGFRFPDFLENYSLGQPYVCELARLEWRCHEAAHEADATPAQGSDLPLDSAKKLRPLQLPLLPSVKLMTSLYPVDDILQKGEAFWRLGVPAEECRFMISRPSYKVRIDRLPVDTFLFLQMLSGGATVAEACDCTCYTYPDFKLKATMRELIRAECIAGESIPFRNSV